MQHFNRLSAAIDTRALLEEIASVDNAWGLSTGRQEKIAVQREALAIPIRGLRKSAMAGRERRDVQESRWTTGSANFPQVRRLFEYWARRTDSLPGRAKIVCLPAGKRVYPHIDRGEYYRLHNRYHAVLKSSQGSWLKAGEEEIRMREGELWWFDNKQVHEARNDGTEDRIHIIFDLLPARLAKQAYSQIPLEAA
ncbi:MAG: aspartyl/asparaginyl beta-hydroxylase domain-containing protein [Pseudomonadota bacterium]